MMVDMHLPWDCACAFCEACFIRACFTRNLNCCEEMTTKTSECFDKKCIIHLFPLSNELRRKGKNELSFFFGENVMKGHCAE